MLDDDQTNAAANLLRDVDVTVLPPDSKADKIAADVRERVQGYVDIFCDKSAFGRLQNILTLLASPDPLSLDFDALTIDDGGLVCGYYNELRELRHAWTPQIINEQVARLRCALVAMAAEASNTWAHEFIILESNRDVAVSHASNLTTELERVRHDLHNAERERASWVRARARNSYVRTFAPLAVFTIVLVALIGMSGYLVLHDLATHPKITIDYNVGEIVGALLAGVGAAAAGGAYAIKTLRPGADATRHLKESQRGNE